MSALGYYIPGEQSRIDIQFLPKLEGYIWVFPRCGHLSVGICGKGEPAASLRKRLERFMGERGICWKGGRFYNHLLPSLDTKAVEGDRVADYGGRPTLPGAQEAADAEPESQLVRDRDELGLQPHRAGHPHIVEYVFHEHFETGSTLSPRGGEDPGRRDLAGARVPQRGRAAAVHR